MPTIIEKLKINKMNKEQIEVYIVFHTDKMSLKLKEVSILRYGEFTLKEKGVAINY